MEFTGRIYFSCGSPDVFRLYRMLDEAAGQGVAVSVEWIGVIPNDLPPGPLQGDALATAMAEYLRVEHPGSHESFLQAVLALVHVEGIDIDHPGLMQRALSVAAIDLAAIEATATDDNLRGLLAASNRAASDLGVTDVPSIYRHGPSLFVRTTPAVASGSASQRLALISGMLEDDGLWELRKPQGA